jgi:hypothetical protein
MPSSPQKGASLYLFLENGSKQNFGRFYYKGKKVERIKDDTV